MFELSKVTCRRHSLHRQTSRTHIYVLKLIKKIHLVSIIIQLFLAWNWCYKSLLRAMLQSIAQ
jgi:hypothetical protein